MPHIWPMYDLYMVYIAVFLYMPSLVYLLVQRFLGMVETGSRPGRERIPTGQELNRRLGRPGEGQGGPSKGHLESRPKNRNPKIVKIVPSIPVKILKTRGKILKDIKIH